jgi:two-component system sensor histidine kinase KdpD
MWRNRVFAKPAWRLCRGALLVAAVTAACYLTGLNSASTALLFLIAVVLQSLDCTFFEAAAISVLAVVSLDYFFTPPLFSFAVEGPLEAISLVCLLIVSLVITRIQSRSRAEARESKLQRSNMERLYNVSQELLALAPPEITGRPAGAILGGIRCHSRLSY